MVRAILAKVLVMALFIIALYVLKLNKREGKSIAIIALAVIPGAIVVEAIVNVIMALLETVLIQINLKTLAPLMAVDAALIVALFLGAMLLITFITDSGKPEYWLGVLTALVILVTCIFEIYEVKNLNEFMEIWDLATYEQYLEMSEGFNRLDVIQSYINIIPGTAYAIGTCLKGLKKKK